ncbi:adhesion G protein-coupled receptor E5-like [Patiria miniata]|uniref:Uncharacterized protein n=1 Tax=Patiria miniata TaxID=46514 RepID=A0A914AMT5_PATMI|nr:adhesion G protein-coupled receptor E5-like [Patiria miniata]
MAVYTSLESTSAPLLKSDSKQPARFGSLIVDLTIISENGTPFTDFKEAPFNLTLPVFEIYDNEFAICSFRSGDDPIWYTDGCWVTSVAADDVTCSCDHLTHFAILLQVKEVRSYNHTFILSLLTRIGLGLSIACLVVTLMTYVFCRLTSDRILTHANLALSLMASHVTFLFTGTSNETACTAVAILLHFFLLAAFTWMALEGVFLYIKSTPTFRWTIRIPVWLSIGWGCPAVVVGISVAIRSRDYTRPGSCWLSFDGGLVWAFLAPVICVLIGNIFVLIRLIRIFYSLKSNQDKSKVMKLKAGLRMMLVLEPLLAMSWIFGVFFIDEATIFFAYASVVLNTLQGVFVFLFQCVFDQEVRQAFAMRASKVQAINIRLENTATTMAGSTSQH